MNGADRGGTAAHLRQALVSVEISIGHRHYTGHGDRREMPVSAWKRTCTWRHSALRPVAAFSGAVTVRPTRESADAACRPRPARVYNRPASRVRRP